MRSEYLLGSLDETVVDGFVTEDIVRGDAGLSGVDPFSPENSLRGDVQVDVAVQVDGRFSAEFEDDGRKVLLRRSVDDLAHLQ